MQFAAPSTTGSTLKPAEVEGHLLVVEPIEYIENMSTNMGPTDAIRVNVHDITDQDTHTEVLWFPTMLVGSLKRMIGQQVLGVMGKGTAKAGQSAPWLLVDASGTTEAVEAATTYLTARQSQGFAEKTVTSNATVSEKLAKALGELKTTPGF